MTLSHRLAVFPVACLLQTTRKYTAMTICHCFVDLMNGQHSGKSWDGHWRWHWAPLGYWKPSRPHYDQGSRKQKQPGPRAMDALLLECSRRLLIRIVWAPTGHRLSGTSFDSICVVERYFNDRRRHTLHLNVNVQKGAGEGNNRAMSRKLQVNRNDTKQSATPRTLLNVRWGKRHIRQMRPPHAATGKTQASLAVFDEWANAWSTVYTSATYRSSDLESEQGLEFLSSSNNVPSCGDFSPLETRLEPHSFRVSGTQTETAVKLIVIECEGSSIVWSRFKLESFSKPKMIYVALSSLM